MILANNIKAKRTRRIGFWATKTGRISALKDKCVGGAQKNRFPIGVGNDRVVETSLPDG